MRVDLITSIKGASFKKIWKNRVRGRLGTEKAYFIGLKELILSKRAAARPQDIADLGILEKALLRKKKHLHKNPKPQ